MTTTPNKTFQVQAPTLTYTYTLLPDGIEYTWKSPFGNGTGLYPASNISGRITERKHFGYGNLKRIRQFAITLFWGLLVHFGFTHPVLHWISWCIFLSAAFGLVGILSNTRKRHWVYVMGPSADTVFSVDVGRLSGISLNEFLDAIKTYETGKPTKTGDSTSEAGSSPVSPR